jgi:hypothetical protein
MRLEITANNRKWKPERMLDNIESCGLVLCARCARNFTSTRFCAACEEIAIATQRRINIGLADDFRRRRRHTAYRYAAAVAFWALVACALGWMVTKC